jgi:type I restriction enzyme S subunit
MVMATVKLGDIAIEAKSSNKGDKTGIRIVGLEHLTPSNVTLSSWNEDTENTFTKEFSKGDVLFGRRRAYLKKAAVAPFDGICSGDITVIRAIEDKVDPDLLPFIIQNDFLFDFAVGKSAGSLSPRVKWTHLKEFAIELPLMPEQSKLAETLWSINETKNAYEDLINKTDELVKSQFIEMFGDIENNQKGYPIKQINEFSDLFAGATPSTKVSAYWKNGTIPWMSSGEVHMGRVTSTEKKISQLGYDKCSTKMVPLHTVVIALAGQGKTRGTVAVTEIELCTNQSLCAMVTDETVLSDYLYHNLRNRYEEIRNMCAIADGRGGLNLKIVGSIKVIVPSIEEQQQFVAFAEQSDKSKFALQEAIKDLDALTKKIIAENLIPAGKE